MAVLDTGVAYEDAGIYRRAPDLAGTRFVPGWDFVDGDAHPNDEPPGDHHAAHGRPAAKASARSHASREARAHRELGQGRRSHGTHIAGVIAQTTGNGFGAAGVAPHAAIMPVRVLEPDGTGSPETIAKGLRFATDRGADVANLSLEGTAGAKVLADAVAYASSRGVAIVASAGNEGRARVSFPAAYPQVVSVGAVRLDKTRAHYSNYGRGLDLVAPGGDMNVDQNRDGSGDGVFQQTLRGDPSTFCFCFSASTSAAAAHVAGAAALLVASGRATAPADVRSALRSSAEDLGPRGRDDEYGAGLVQVSSALEAAADARSGPTRLALVVLLTAGGGVAGLMGLARWRRRRERRRSLEPSGR